MTKIKIMVLKFVEFLLESGLSVTFRGKNWTLFWVKVTLYEFLLKFDYFFRILVFAAIFGNLYNIDAFWVV